jgi:hypothetical protein
MVPCDVEQAVLSELGLVVYFPWRFKPAEASIPARIGFLDAILHAGRPTTVKITPVRYPIRLLVKYLIKPVRVFDKLQPVLKDAFPTPVHLCIELIATLGLINLRNV